MKKRMIIILLAFTLVMVTGTAFAPPAAGSFSDVVSGNPLDYDTYQVKVTYTGDQTKLTPTLLLVGNGRFADVTEFTPYRSPAVHYGNDDAPEVIDLTVSGSSIGKVIAGILEKPDLQTVGGATEPFLSLMIERDQPPSEIVFEHLCDQVESEFLLNILEGALRSETDLTREQMRKFRNFTLGQH